MNYFASLQENLDLLKSLYVELEGMLWEEHRNLMGAHVDKIEVVNSTKETLLKKIALAEKNREALMNKLGQAFNKPNASLQEIAELAGDLRSALLTNREELRQLIFRVQDINQQNRECAENALRVLGGALSNIKDTLAGKKTYQKKGLMKSGPEQSGNFVSKEA